MNAEDWSRLREIYDAVCDAPPDERDRLIAQRCAGLPELEREVRALLTMESAGNSFLDTSLAQLLAPRPAAGDVLCERFELLQQLGMGGMGEVWAARDRSLDETVAVKMIRSTHLSDEDGLARFKREIQLARRISHPNVCRVYELFEDRGRPFPLAFLTMELLAGETLAAHLAARGALDYATATAILRDVAAGLHAAHMAGVIHRDLKPANVMLVAGTASLRAVVMDFGLARAALAETDRAITRAPVGTPEYMAPEQITGAAVSAATDVYALGLLLFEMLSGRPPFAGANTFESFMRRAREGPERLSGVVPGVPPRIDQVLARCLQYEPERRFAGVCEVLDAIGAPRSFWRLPLRRAVPAAAALLALAGVGFVASQVRQATAVPQDALRWYADAQQALAEGAAVRALNDVTRAIEAAPGFASAHAAEAEILIELDMPVRAQEAILSASRLVLEQGARDAKEQDYIEGIQSLLLRNCDTAAARLESRSRRGPAIDPYDLLTMARALERCGRLDDAQRVLQEAAQLDPRNAAVPLRQARLLARRPDYAAAMAELSTAESLFRDRNNIEGVGEVLATRGTLQAEQDRLDEAEVTLQKAGEVALSLEDTRQQVRVLLARAIVRRKQGEVASADVLTREAISLARGAGLETLTLEGLFTAANVHVVRNQFAAAEALFEQALAVADTHRDEASRARARLSLATVFVRSMEHDRALQAIAAARPYFARIGHQRNLRIADTLVGQVRMHRGEYEEAVSLYAGSLDAARRERDPEQEVMALENLATAEVGAGRYPQGLASYRQALARHRQAGRTRSATFALLNIADTLSKLGQFQESRRALAEAAAVPLAAAEIRAAMLLVQASDALRRGRYGEAAQTAMRADTANAGGSFERSIRVRLVRCAAAARAGDVRRARGLCGSVLQDVSPMRHKALRLEAVLTHGEASLAAGDGAAIDDAVAEAQPLMPRGEHADRWRFLALTLAAPATKDRAGAQAALARELETLRLKWGEDAYETWQRRDDVRLLMHGSQRAVREEKE